MGEPTDTGDDTRLIEVDFPLEQVSLDSVHEKNVRHGHISTLHIWPARRPLAASRAALIATLLPDPGNAAERKEIYRRLAGETVETVKTEQRNGRTIERRKRETRGGILHWKRESGADLDWFRERIREAYGGRAPKVLDPFAGGGAIPLEAMRLGCETTAVDINPVAWFILKCTLDYPSRLAGKTLPLPDFARGDHEFLEAFLKAKGFKGKALRDELATLGQGTDGGGTTQNLLADALPHNDASLQGDLAWHVRAWGRRVLNRVRATLAERYPTYAEFQPLLPGGRDFEARTLAFLAPDGEGKTDVDRLNTTFDAAYLKDPRNPRWVEKPTVAYLWARTVRCKGCRATIPLLKTRWLAKKSNKRVLLTLTPRADGSGVEFGVEAGVPPAGGNAAQRREHDNQLGSGTMSSSGGRCPCCASIMTMEDIRLEGRAGRLGSVMTAVVVEGPKTKEYRLPEARESRVAEVSEQDLDTLYANVPFGLPTELTPRQGQGASRAFSVENYGLDQWGKLLMGRQLATQRAIIDAVSRARPELVEVYGARVADAITGFLACIMDRQADYGSAGCIWVNTHEHIGHQFSRYALPIIWDIAEVCPLTTASGGLESAYVWVTKVVDHLVVATSTAPEPTIALKSAIDGHDDCYDLIITDPPYYDAIPYSDLMDFFHVWLRRLFHTIENDLRGGFLDDLGPKWDAASDNGELIDDASRFDGDKTRSKSSYEDGMARAFQSCHRALTPEGRLVIVFASKNPAAWETLVAALIRAGFVVDSSWPIQTERQTRLRSVGSAALAASVWLVCRKRPPARPGWDAAVLTEMRANVTRKLRDFWDAGIRGPDFVWAATGPALEAFSKHPVVKKADRPGETMAVSEFLGEVRRMVVDFVVGRVMTGEDGADAAAGLDDVTTYYLLHRGDFGLDDAPVGACILYALSCNLSDRDLSDRYGILSRPKGSQSDDSESDESEADDGDAETGGGRGNKVKLLPWNRRKAKSLGHQGPGGRPVPLVDRVHRLMRLWHAGDESKVNGYLDDHGLGRNALFSRLVQALIELAAAGSEERAILESLSNHIASRADGGPSRQKALGLEANS